MKSVYDNIYRSKRLKVGVWHGKRNVRNGGGAVRTARF